MRGIGLVSRLLWAIAGAWMVLAGSNDLSVRSQSSIGSNGEQSLMALGIRSQGSLKIGLGLAALGASTIGCLGDNCTASKPVESDMGAGYKSSGSPRDDFNAVVATYLDRGGAGNPDYNATNMLANTILLRNSRGDDLAYFARREGQWDAVKIYK